MKAYKVELIIIDYEEIGPDITWELENLEYARADIISVQEADIGEWSDDHPLNLGSTTNEDKLKYFDNEKNN